MIWLQAGTCFALWVAYGLWMRRSSDRLRARMLGSPRRNRALLGSAGLLAGLGVLTAGLWGVYSLGWAGPDGLKPFGWVGVAAIGLAFIHLQVLGAAAMVTLVMEEVTAPSREPSVKHKKEQP